MNPTQLFVLEEVRRGLANRRSHVQRERRLRREARRRGYTWEELPCIKCQRTAARVIRNQFYLQAVFS